MGTDYKKLQNGSDIRGVACEGVPGEAVTLTEDAAVRIGRAFAAWLAGKTGKSPRELRIGVGRDSRITGQALLSAFRLGVQEAGAVCVDCGMASTPAMFMSIVYPETGFDGSCMITASHLPFNRNGLKFFDQDGGLDKPDIARILQMVEETAAENPTGAVKEPGSPSEDAACSDPQSPEQESFDLIRLYAAHLRDAIRSELRDEEPAGAGGSQEYKPEPEEAGLSQPLAGLHIVTDAGNGAGGFFAEQVLRPLGADIAGSRYLEPDGTFPNHQPNPENREAMQAICEATTAAGADLGLIFDTDVDRMSAVFSDGTPVNRDAIIALTAAILASEHPGSTIITDSVTSDRLTEFLENKLGLKHLCYRRGYKNVINKCRELNAEGTDSPLAMETSGHGCLKENYYLDDGAFLAVKIVIAAARAKREGRHLHDLIRELNQKYADAEMRFSIRAEDFGAYGQQVLTEFRNRADAAGYTLPQAFEGVRIRFEQEKDGAAGWLLLRASLHDPVMVLNMESTDAEGLAQIRRIVKTLMEGFDRLAIPDEV